MKVRFLILGILLYVLPIYVAAEEEVSKDVPANAISRQKTAPHLKTSKDLCVWKFGGERLEPICYRLRKIGSPKSEECAWLGIDPKGTPTLWVRSLGSSFTDKYLTKINQDQAKTLFGEPSCSTSSYNLIGWRGDGDPEIFHILLGFNHQGFCNSYRVSGSGVRSVWILFEKENGERTIFPQHSGNVDKNHNSCLANSGYYQRKHVIKRETKPAIPNIPNFQ